MTDAEQFVAKLIQNKALDPFTVKFQQHNSTDSKHFHSTSLHSKCVPEVYQNDLAKVVSTWDELSDDAKRRIVEIVEAGL